MCILGKKIESYSVKLLGIIVHTKTMAMAQSTQ